MKLNQIAAGFTVALSATLLISSCSSSVPDHARLIPKDAVVVAGINTRELSKKIAWNAILGSKILDQIKEQQPKDAAKQLDQAGIENMSTSYVYMRPVPGGSNRITALIPLNDVAKWEAYVKQVFPHATVSTVKDRKEASLADNMYVGWNNKLLIVMNIIPGAAAMSQQYSPEVADTVQAGTADTVVVMPPPPSEPVKADASMLGQEMEKAFSVPKENSLTEDSRFTKLEKEGHDITLWINYDALMSQAQGIAGMAGGLGMVNALWKNTAAAAGFDFEKGRIAGEAKYYVSDVLKEAGKELGGENTDREMLERLPAQNLDAMMGWHLSPKGVKTVMDKTGLSGIMGFALMSQGISVDDIMNSVTGDMVMSLNDLAMQSNTGAAADSVYHAYGSDIKMNYVYAMKIGKKDLFNKVLQYAIAQQFLVKTGDNTYKVGGDNGGYTIAIDDHYFVAANTVEGAQAFLAGKYKGQKLPEAAKKEVFGHPMGLYADIQAMAKAMNIPQGTDAKDMAMMEQSKKLLDYVSMNGGEFKGDAFSSHVQISFMDKSENSLLQLIGFAMNMQQMAMQQNDAPQVNAADTAGKMDQTNH